jgi:hypothetical protein
MIIGNKGTLNYEDNDWILIETLKIEKNGRTIEKLKKLTGDKIGY